MTAFQRLPRRLRAAGLHLLLSAVVATAAAFVVFVVWYPPPFSAIAGGLGLFTLLVSVDVVLGPALTAVAASPGKPLRELRRDLALIVAIQFAGFAYGMYTIALARPVSLSFEVDSFRVEAAVDIDTASLAEAPEGLRTLSWTGPRIMAAVKPTDSAERLRAVDLGLAGIGLSALPKFWRDYASQREEVWKAAKPLKALLTKYPQASGPAGEIALHSGHAIDDLRFLPLVSRQASWSVVVSAPDASVIGYLPFDGYF